MEQTTIALGIAGLGNLGGTIAGTVVQIQMGLLEWASNIIIDQATKEESPVSNAPQITREGVSPPLTNHTSTSTNKNTSTATSNNRQTGWYVIDANTGSYLSGPFPNENAAFIQMPKGSNRMYTTKYYYAA